LLLTGALLLLASGSLLLLLGISAIAALVRR
jgi:hypothetical protein